MPPLREEMQDLHRNVRSLFAPLIAIVERIVARLDRDLRRFF